MPQRTSPPKVHADGKAWSLKRVPTAAPFCSPVADNNLKIMYPLSFRWLDGEILRTISPSHSLCLANSTSSSLGRLCCCVLCWKGLSPTATSAGGGGGGASFRGGHPRRTASNAASAAAAGNGNGSSAAERKRLTERRNTEEVSFVDDSREKRERPAKMDF